ncbi:hypothetical protein BDV95DRAFT_628673 [Massariosphaeria phaeospora]|uniref:Uncharacterized protein n=1 Tax=Massariosphaeria phaeospora TaxID=100035 RepID=A0A7C8I9D8_9PLEO|nr:hypothetical protein BDV95DRAFT_628673 [Massariosphaeria phaeospora]
MATSKRTRLFLFGSRPSEGTLSRYAINEDYSLVHEGTMDIPRSCNTTRFASVHLTSRPQLPSSIFGSASTGLCSTLFAVDVTGFYTMRSAEYQGDFRSLSWSPNGRNLRTLESHSSDPSSSSILNFHISDNANLEDLVGTDILTNVTSAEQLISHPIGNRAFIVTKNSNELVDIALQQNGLVDSSAPPGRRPTLSQSGSQAIISVFSLNATTGAVEKSIARSSWQGMGNGVLVAAPFGGADLVAVTNAPVGMVAILGLDVGSPAKSVAAPKIKAFGRIDLGLEGLGEGVWVN